MEPDVSVIIVSYNTRDITLACVRSVLERSGDVTVEIIVVDNASEDGSVDALRAEFPQITVIASDENRGFAAGNNAGLAVARGRYLLLLNSDTEVHDGCLERMVAFAEAHPKAGAIGCRSFWSDGVQQPTMMRSPRLRHVLVNVLVPNRIIRRSRLLSHARYPGIDFDEVHDIEVIAGCFMLVPRAAYEEVGGMDESFFMYGEEIEWCFRIRRAGWRIMYNPDAAILHYGGVSTNKSPDEMSLAMARSQLLVFQRTRGRATAMIANALMMLRDMPRAVFWRIVARTSIPRDAALRAMLRRSEQRFRLHARCLLKPDWGA